MAETITIPSPSLFLNSPAPSPTAQTPTKKAARRPQQAPLREEPKASDTNGVTKRKQSKSRNGCITCKAKRLKCDETKPTCQQCARRSVTCGGYKKDFKWRPFEETNFTGKPQGKSKKDAPPPPSVPLPFHVDDPSLVHDPYQFFPNQHPVHNGFFPAPPQGPVFQGPPPTSTFIEPAYPPPPIAYPMPQPVSYVPAIPIAAPIDHFMPGSVESSNSAFEVDSIDTRPTKTTAPSSISSGQSPRLVDLLLPGTDLSVPPEEYMSYRSQFPDSFYQPSGFTPPAELMEDDEIEEIPRNFNPDHEAWVMRLGSPTPSNSSTSSSESNTLSLLSQPQFSSSSPEMLTRRFDRDTCGILSVKDGPTENPWRTLVWPLARDTPALYHAIASMTSFHHSRDAPLMRIQGIDHMRTSVHALASTLENMRVDAAISTTLVLAFSESWDQHISTGINHIKGAKLLIDKALVQHNRKPVHGEELDRLKFLCNTWIYMDVIARLTSADDDESNDFDIVSDAVYMNGNGAMDAKLDPLMGCAGTLFLIIGRVANLVRKVRRSNNNSPSIISQAVELKKQLEDWVPPAFIEDPEDDTTSPHDSLKTAAAYQYATLLYLHQAVPEIPSVPAHKLAKRALCELATVEPRSRSVIVHIYPLMAAGCEAVEVEDRQWVQSRWEMLASRMKLGIIEKCLEVTKEVWTRRDAFAAEYRHDDQARNEGINATTPALKRSFSSFSEDEADGLYCWLDATKRRALNGTGLFDSPQPIPVKSERNEGKRRSDTIVEALQPEFTVKGRLHWLGVMKDWNWEVLLG
ncbi:hypothetical protein K491DRAFT_73537 [Lophiostoma macrostomum CBS 122681]|uniref:Zn(2)-C6 fungal-type domain-containing protein n=1 Tax=Lophiostoma macrostomum CBS 122681 TaxID=1314788 RepID=A0A6A6SY93_9PLEO|nr:hypothetical protein K491DRAFT_73537 [Lophiostoma macrostomum CBS 122681]